MVRTVICDDEKAALNIIQYFIESENLPIEVIGTAENGRDALKLIEKTKPDLVFMDIHMPFMNGFEVIQSIQNTKVVVITAYDSFEYAQRALRLNVCDIISKPIEFSQLKQAITRAVGWGFTNNETVNHILEYIHHHYDEKIELEDLAGETYCTESHIARLFKKYMNMTILNYIHKVRIENAVRFLRNERLSIQETALRTGYQNLNNFYKYFKIFMGETPAVFLHKNEHCNEKI